ncbi:hypothetical protein M569_05439 [Genlisea aurea]|uniref:Pectinesterase n=1 Tax=Genlisea aurea TaxID=192259 RepID=S8CQ64_9LAMI|nr:hypothetical protein M569_05439 [Genlisea aurea]
MAGKPIIIGVSVVLVVGVVIGLIAGISHYKSGDDENKANKDALNSATKNVATICAATTFQKSCVDTLSPIGNNASATPKDFLAAAINAAVKELQAAMARPGEAAKGATHPIDKMAVEDCKDLFQSAVADLQASFSAVGDSQMHTVSDREAELMNWMSAVISYSQACADGFDSPTIRSAVSDGILNATQLTDNALAIVGAISELLKSFNIPLNTTAGAGAATSRRLLEGSADDDVYPLWMPAGDRKLLASGSHPQPNAVVAKDGSGKYSTISAALAAYPANLKGRYVIYVKAGVYHEYVKVDKKMVNVYIYGDGPRKTIVTGSKSYADGYSVMESPTFSVAGNGFIAKSMGFTNTAGPEGHQAVALLVQGDRSAFYNCRMDGYQDTLYTLAHHQFYRNCVISGTVDFIFGDASVLIQNCLIIVRKPMDGQFNAVTAQGKEFPHESTGIVIQNCRIVPEQKLEPLRFEIESYLGRPWKTYSTTIIMESTLGDFIRPEGWSPWSGSLHIDTLFYREYANRGPGANTSKRVHWKGYKVITNRNEALPWTANPFIQGSQWLKATGIPFFVGLKN